MRQSIKVKVEREPKKIKDKQAKNKLMSTLVITWFILSFGIFIVGGILENAYIIIMNFGQYMLFFGITGYKATKDKMTLIPGIIGAACIIIPLLIMISIKISLGVDWEKIIILLFLMIFILAGLGMTIIPLIKYFNKKKYVQ